MSGSNFGRLRSKKKYCCLLYNLGFFPLKSAWLIFPRQRAKVCLPKTIALVSLRYILSTQKLGFYTKYEILIKWVRKRWMKVVKKSGKLLLTVFNCVLKHDENFLSPIALLHCCNCKLWRYVYLGWQSQNAHCIIPLNKQPATMKSQPPTEFHQLSV